MQPEKEMPWMLKIAFMPLYNLWGPSSRYRVFQFLEPLSKLGFRCRVLPAPEKIAWKRLAYLPRLLQSARQFDILYVQKRLFPSWVLHTLKQINPRIIYDFDDAVYLQPHKQQAFQNMLQQSKIVVAGNQHLAKKALELAQHVEIIPSVVDTNLYCPSVPLRHPDDQRIILGWIGTDPNRGDLAPFQSVFDWLGDRYKNRIVFRTVGRCPLEMVTSLPVEFVRWELETSRQVLQQFDIGIMPLDDTEWNRGKCALKLLQYMAVEAATVASPVGVNKIISLEKETGFLAVTTRDWRDSLAQLIEDAPLREKMGREGRKRVEQFYSITTILPKMVEVLEAAAE